MRINQISALSILFIISTFFGCSKKGQNLELIQSNIVNGTKVSGEYNSIVSLVYKERQLCTASLVSPNLLITAAHCILDKELPKTFPDFIEETKVYVGPGIEGGKLQGQYKIKKAEIHPLYKNHLYGMNDIAFIELETPITNVKPIKMLTNFSKIKETISTGKEVTIVGYGYRVNSIGEMMKVKDQVGVKYKTIMNIDRHNSNEIVLKKKGTGACQGDSGGPAIVHVDQTPYLIGAASRVKGKCGGDGETYYSLISDSVCWFKKNTDLDFGELDILCATEEKVAPRSLCEINSQSDKLTLNALKRVLKVDTCEEVQALSDTVTELDLNNQFLTSVKLLKYFQNLESLRLEDNKISTIDSLKELDNLKLVDITWNNIPEEEFDKFNFDLLGSKKQFHNHFKTLFYNTCIDKENASKNNQIILEEVLFSVGTQDCLEAHVKFKYLTDLALEGLGLDNVEILKDYNSIMLLYLDSNNITDLSPLSGMKALETLYISNNKIKDISFLKELKSLTYVDSSNNEIEDISFLEDIDNYLMINLQGNDIQVMQHCSSNSKVTCM